MYFSFSKIMANKIFGPDFYANSDVIKCIIKLSYIHLFLGSGNLIIHSTYFLKIEGRSLTAYV